MRFTMFSKAGTDLKTRYTTWVEDKAEKGDPVPTTRAVVSGVGVIGSSGLALVVGIYTGLENGALTGVGLGLLILLVGAGATYAADQIIKCATQIPCLVICGEKNADEEALLGGAPPLASAAP